MPRRNSAIINKRTPVSALESTGRQQFSSVCIWASLISSVRPLLRRMEFGPLTIVCLVPDGIDPVLYEAAWDSLCAKLAWKLNVPRGESNRAFVFPADEKTAKLNGLTSGDRWSAAFAVDLNDVPGWFMLYAEDIVRIRSITARDIQAAARLTVGINMDAGELAKVVPAQLTVYDHIFQPRRSRAHITKAIRLIAQANTHEHPPTKPGLFTLDELHGMGDAVDWAKQVIQDLADWREGKIKWREVDRGAVLYGAPGTGKTSFAKAMANSAKVPLITGSLARWQAAGHLGDMLKSMRAAFASAGKQAPAILLIDEIDVIGDRATLSSQHRDYDSKVIAALLELLDGAEAREGVVVIATSNFDPRRALDPALIRPGRLEVCLEISVPDQHSRIAILRYHGAAIPEAELARVAQRTEGRTGAELEALVRAAKRHARQANRDQCFDDYLRALPGTHRIPDPVIRRMAIHECGHGIAAVILGHGRLDSIKILREIAVDTQQIAAGRTKVEISPFSSRSRSDIEDEIVVMLAGMAAEELVYGDWTEGSGLSELSDLGRATSLAVYMAGTLGMNGSLARVVDEPSRVWSIDKALKHSVDEILAAGMSRARTIVRDGQDALIRMSEALIASSELTNATIRSIIEDCAALEIPDDQR